MCSIIFYNSNLNQFTGKICFILDYGAYGDKYQREFEIDILLQKYYRIYAENYGNVAFYQKSRQYTLKKNLFR